MIGAIRVAAATISMAAVYINCHLSEVFNYQSTIRWSLIISLASDCLVLQLIHLPQLRSPHNCLIVKFLKQNIAIKD